jgi:short-subunit dehydrogenase
MIVITGASDGLGHEIAKVFKASGKRVVNVSRRECSVADDNLLHDLSDAKEIQAAVNEILKIDEPLEVLVNNAGIWTEEPMDEISDAAAEAAWAINAKAPMLLTAGLLDRIKKDQADVVNVVSNAGLDGSKHHAAYVASKYAERGFNESLREELRDTLCRVIGFYPGGISTGLFVKATDNDITKNGYWMEPDALATCIKQLLDLPKGIEVYDIRIGRKKAYK